MSDATAAERVGVLARHLAVGVRAGAGASVHAQPTRARAALPRFDTVVMEKYIDDLSDLKEEVYELFRGRPDLLPPIIEDMTKGAHNPAWPAALHKSAAGALKAWACERRAAPGARAQVSAGRPGGWLQPAALLHRQYQEVLLLGRAAGARRPVAGTVVSFLSESRALLATGSAGGSRGALAQTVKMGVQYSLWGGSVLNLGTERHRKAYFDDIDKFRLPGICPAHQMCS